MSMLRMHYSLLLLQVRNRIRLLQSRGDEGDLRGAVTRALEKIREERGEGRDPDTLVNAPEWLISLEMHKRDREVPD